MGVHGTHRGCPGINPVGPRQTGCGCPGQVGSTPAPAGCPGRAGRDVGGQHMKACAVQGLEGSSGIRPQTREHSQQYGQQQGGSPGKGTSLLPLQAGPPPETPRRFLACVGSKWATGRDEQAWLPAGPDGVGGAPHRCRGTSGPIPFLFIPSEECQTRAEQEKRPTKHRKGGSITPDCVHLPQSLCPKSQRELEVSPPAYSRREN